MDRGFLFGDAVYEVFAVLGGRLVDEARHFARLHRSLHALGMAPAPSDAALGVVLRRLVRLNHVRNGMVYLQISRGAPAIRDHAFPSPDTPATIVAFARGLDMAALDARAVAGIAVITYPENRWARCDIKSTALLANVLAKQAAKTQGAQEALYVDRDGMITEGASSNVWIVDQSGCLRTRALSHQILPGVTRASLIAIAAAEGFQVEERAFDVEALRTAREAFITSAMSLVTPMCSVDGDPVGAGTPGPIAVALRAAYKQAAQTRDH
jgi:D-alanine transaminase